MMNVYVLTTGIQVERYQIVSVHSSMERALEEKLRRDDYRDNDIKEYEIDPKLTPVKEGFELGKVYCIKIHIPSESIEKQEKTKYRHPEKCEIECYSWIRSGTIIEVFSPISMEHAEKVANEEKEKLLRGIEQ